MESAESLASSPENDARGGPQLSRPLQRLSKVAYMKHLV